MPENGKSKINWADHSTLATVRPEVRSMLESSEAFRKLPADEQLQIAGTMVKVAAYMANPDGLAAQELTPGKGVLAESQADAIEDTKKSLSGNKGFAGKDFEAGAVRQGVEQFGQMVQKVDFPKFVSGLIQNVFQAIVDASIQQMKAYGELLANVAKTVDQFAQDNISENSARDYLTDRFPDQLGVGMQGPDAGLDANAPEGAATPQPKLTVTAEDPEAALKTISDNLGLAKPVTDIEDPNEERRLVMAARLQIARGRQQLLASMVVLGINRIVVTDGLIHAKVVFDMRAQDTARRQSRAAMYDKTESHFAQQAEVGFSSWLSPWSGSASEQSSNDHMTTVQSSLDETSQSKAEVKANLTGEVRVNFKSDYFPMEKMATPQMIAAIQGNSTPVEKAASPAAIPASSPAGK